MIDRNTDGEEIIGHAAFKKGTPGYTPVPDLPHNCNSWIVVDRVTGDAFHETWDRDHADRLAARGYEVVTALTWLQRVNAKIKGAQ